VHDIGIMLSSENVPCATHISRELVNFVKSTIYNFSANYRVAKIANEKVIRIDFSVFRELQVDAPYPKSFALQPVGKVTANEASGTKNKSSFHPCVL